MWDNYTYQMPSIFIRGKLLLSSEMMLHKDYDCKGSDEQFSGSEPEGT
jgi:hypothetical protein